MKFKKVVFVILAALGIFSITLNVLEKDVANIVTCTLITLYFAYNALEKKEV